MNPEADALQWAIDQIDALSKRDDRTQEERNYLHTLEKFRDNYENHNNKKAYRKLTN